MSVELMIAALRRGKTGDEILSILEAFSSEIETAETASPESTLDPINV